MSTAPAWHHPDRQKFQEETARELALALEANEKPCADCREPIVIAESSWGRKVPVDTQTRANGRNILIVRQGRIYMWPSTGGQYGAHRCSSKEAILPFLVDTDSDEHVPSYAKAYENFNDPIADIDDDGYRYGSSYADRDRLNP